MYVVESVSAGVAKFKLKDGEDVSKFNENTTFFAMKAGTGGTSIPNPYLFDINASGEGGIRAGLASVKSIKEATINNEFFSHNFVFLNGFIFLSIDNFI